MIPTSPPTKWINSIPSQDRVYFTICIILRLLDTCNPGHDFRAKLKTLMQTIRPEQMPSLGFPTNWKEQSLFAD